MGGGGIERDGETITQTRDTYMNITGLYMRSVLLA